MSTPASTSPALSLGGVPLDAALRALRRLEPNAHACYVYDLDELERRARRFEAAFSSLRPLVAFALKANGLPAILEHLSGLGLGGEAGSVGELELARAAGFPAARRVLNGNGRTREEAEWVALHGVHSVNADHVEELDLLEHAAAREERRLRVALRVNPGIITPGHRYVATGDEEAKFGVSTAEALAAWSARARWPHLDLDGVHVHVGSQLLEAAPARQAAEVALTLAAESARRGTSLGLINLGGGFGVDYAGGEAEFPLERYAQELSERAMDLDLEWVFEPGRWLAAPIGVLIAEVLWIKRRDRKRFVVLAAGMNDLLRPALYKARHRIVPVRPRPGPPESATVVGPVCESADVFADSLELPPLEPGDLVALMDAGAYGATMASNYNGRGRLAELVVRDGRIFRARAGETATDLARRRVSDPLEV